MSKTLWVTFVDHPVYYTSDGVTVVGKGDVKFHEIFWREIFYEIFLKYFKNLTMDCECRLYSSQQQSK